MQIEIGSKQIHIQRWFDSHWTGLMIIRRHYHLIKQATASKKEIDRDPGKSLLPVIFLSALRGVRGWHSAKGARSRYDVVVCWAGLYISFCLLDSAPPRMLCTSSSSPLTCSWTYKSAQQYTLKNFSQITRAFWHSVCCSVFTKTFSIKRTCVGVLPAKAFLHKYFADCTFPSL